MKALKFITIISVYFSVQISSAVTCSGYFELFNKNQNYFASKSINHPHLHLWDNWGFEDNGAMHMYSLAADKNLPAAQRHFSAKWVHFVSLDSGRSWRELGTVLKPSGKNGSVIGKAIWSGSVTKMKSGQYWAAITGVEGGSEALQTISIAVSKDAHNFKRFNTSKALLDHRTMQEKWKRQGYYIADSSNLGSLKGEVDGTIQALRDPFLLQTKNGQIHMFWAAKKDLGNGKTKQAIGHVKFNDINNPDNFTLLKPIEIPNGSEFKELELPNVIELKSGKFAWIVSTTNKKSQSQGVKDYLTHSRLYYSDNIGSELKVKRNNIFLSSADSNYYGANIIQGSLNNNKVKVRVFNQELLSGPLELTLPKTLELNLDTGKLIDF